MRITLFTFFFNIFKKINKQPQQLYIQQTTTRIPEIKKNNTMSREEEYELWNYIMSQPEYRDNKNKTKRDDSIYDDWNRIMSQQDFR